MPDGFDYISISELQSDAQDFGMSARSSYRVLKLARTIAAVMR